MFLVLIINALLALFGGLDSNKKYPPNYAPNLETGDEFDFIVVGAGSAGSLLASRLSEISQWNILLIEAGGYPSAISEVPALSFMLQDSNEDWQYLMEPSKTYCLGLQKQRCHCPRGRGLGGTSLINAMLYARTTRYDHEGWVNDANVSWDYDTVIEYYKKFENSSLEDNKDYGTNGELPLTRYRSTQPIRKILIKAYEELGYGNYTEENPLGFLDKIQTLYRGTRQSSAKAFLTQAKNRKNLYLALNTQVGKLLINHDDLTVYGVQVKIKDRLLQLKARKEVIVSAGTIASPNILMKSGIGPRDHLAKLGINVIKDLRVGENYQDHLGYPVLAVSISQKAATPVSIIEWMNEVFRFLMNRQGLLTEISISNFYQYINTKNGTGFPDVAIVHVLAQRHSYYEIEQFARCTRMPPEVKTTLMYHIQRSPILILFPMILHPKSTGYIRLRNADPFSPPMIVPNYISDENDEDMKTLLKSIKFLKETIQTKTFASYTPKLIDLDIPRCRKYAPQSVKFWKCAIRNLAFGVYHPVGTCKMGPASDSTAVVDLQLKVHGIKGVRVIDGSIIPKSPSCNTNAPILMIAERGADFIRKEWLQQNDIL